MNGRTRAAAVLLTLICLAGTAACGATLPQDAAYGVQQPESSARRERTEPAPGPSARPVSQSGAVETVLLDGAELYAVAKGYLFVQDDRISVEVAAKNATGNPATIWPLLTGINGWDVTNQQQAVQAIHLAPGEEKTQAIVFDLTGQTVRFLRIGALTQLRFVTEGYVDSTNYEFTMADSIIDVSDAPGEYAQIYTHNEDILLDNEVLTVAYCGRNPQSGEITLYYAVKAAAQGAVCKLYPIENGVFDTQRYPVPDELDMTSQTRRLVTFTPASAGPETDAVPDGFFLVAEGVAMRPERLWLAEQAGKDAMRRAPDTMEVVAKNEWLCIRYDAQSRRFFAENLTDDRVLLLQNDAQFTLDGLTVRANQQRVPCFPQAATAFRISGRGTDDVGVERNLIIGENSRSAAVGWSVFFLSDGLSEPEPAGSIATGEFALTTN